MASVVSVDQLNSLLMKVSRFLKPLIPLVGCHMVDFLTTNHWETILPPQLQQDLMNLSQDKLQYLPSASIDYDTAGCNTSLESWSSSDLPSFLSAIRQHNLPALDVTTPLEQVVREHGIEVTAEHLKGVMSDKKTHEVEVMSQVIAQLAKGCCVDWIVDLGSGRGYLSSSLVVQYGINVVAIDSSQINTASGLVRNSRLQRHWINYKQAEQDRRDGKIVKKGKKKRRKGNQAQNIEKFDNCLELKAAHMSCKQSVPCGRYIGVTRFVTEGTDLASIVSSVVDDEEEKHRTSPSKANLNSEAKDVTNLNDDASERESDQVKHSYNIATKKEKDELHSELDSTMESLRIYANSFASSHKSSKSSSLNISTIDAARIVQATTPTTSANLGTDNRGEKEKRLGLVGLHTCGNLAPSSLRLFLSNPKVSFLCNVGCCYHLLEEEFSENPFSHKKAKNATFENCNLCERDPENAKKNYSEPPSRPTNVYKDSIQQCSSSSPHCCIPGGQKEEAVERVSESEEEREAGIEKLGKQKLERDEMGDQEGKQNTESGFSKQDMTHNPLHPSEVPNLGYGFPMSSFLRETKFAMGRNTRMLSCQPADRLTQGSFNSTESLYWRALLQVVLLDKLKGDESSIGHVGRLSAKCHTFSQYTRMAIDKLGLHVQVTEEELDHYHQHHQEDRDRLERFFLLRASVAPVIEGLMLLDRLAFLREKDPSLRSHLVQLFDPVTSPRCHALVALR